MPAKTYIFMTELWSFTLGAAQADKSYVSSNSVSVLSGDIRIQGVFEAMFRHKSVLVERNSNVYFRDRDKY